MAKNTVVKQVEVRFLKNAAPKDFSGVTFSEGEVYEMSEDSANHWISRGIAELVVPEIEDVAAQETKAKKSSPKADVPAAEDVGNSTSQTQAETRS
jgi:hypothetical protein